MGFTDNLKRSLGFEESEPSEKKENDGTSLTDVFREFGATIKSEVTNFQGSSNNHPQDDVPMQDYDPNVNYNPNHNPNYNPNPNTNPNPNPNYNPNRSYNSYQDVMPQSTPVYDDFDYVITPEQSFYEIALIRPKSIDDVNYVVDQVIEEKNPVILDLSFLERESAANYKLAGDKIKQMREKYGAQAVLLARNEEKNLIIVSPKKVRVINKG